MAQHVTYRSLGIAGRGGIQVTITRHGEPPNARYACQFDPELVTWGDSENEAMANTVRVILASVGAMSKPPGMSSEDLAQLKRDTQWSHTDPHVAVGADHAEP